VPTRPTPTPTAAAAVPAVEAARNGLSDEQRAIVCAPAADALIVVAAPGSGKTRVLSQRVAFLVEGGVPPAAILALTFSRRAARELRVRVLAAGAAGVDVLTFHSLCVRLVRAHAQPLGLAADFGLVNGAQQLQLVQLAAEGALRELGDGDGDGGGDGPSSRADAFRAALRDGAAAQPRACRRLLKAVTDAKTAAALGVDAAAAAEAAAAGAGEAVGALRRAYDGLVRAQNCVDFADVLALGHTLLAQGADSRLISADACAYRHVLLDEYQDTSALQFAMLAALRTRSTRAAAAAGAAAGCGLTIAGDPNQAIFSFLGAAPAVFACALRALPGGAPAVRWLTTNYRSSANILRVAVSILQPPGGGTGGGGGGGGGGGELAGAARAMRTDNAAGALVDVAECRVPEAEADWIAERLHALRDGGKRSAWSEMALLHRTNKEGAELAALLRARGVPASQRGHSAFAGATAAALLAALRCAASPADDLSLAALAGAMGVDNAAMHALRASAAASGGRLLDAARAAHGEGTALAGAADDGGAPRAARLEASARGALGRVLCAIDAIRAEARSGDLAALPAAAVAAGVLGEAAGAAAGGRDAPSAELLRRRAAEAAAALASEAEAFVDAEAMDADAERLARAGGAGATAAPRAPTPRGGISALRRFLAHLASCEHERSATGAQAGGAQADAVAVLTIHAAKGLEFEHVVVARFNEDCLPLGSSRAQASGEDASGQLDEERRLAYVAVTRARSTLGLSYVKSMGGAQMQRSHFLDAVVALGDATVRRAQAYEVRAAGSWPRIARRAAQPASRKAPAAGEAAT
jgi:DNA helicase-2/ATP-dependent DNA helicase PcrA